MAIFALRSATFSDGKEVMSSLSSSDDSSPRSSRIRAFSCSIFLALSCFLSWRASAVTALSPTPRKPSRDETKKPMRRRTSGGKLDKILRKSAPSRASTVAFFGKSAPALPSRARRNLLSLYMEKSGNQADCLAVCSSRWILRALFSPRALVSCCTSSFCLWSNLVVRVCFSFSNCAGCLALSSVASSRIRCSSASHFAVFSFCLRKASLASDNDSSNNSTYVRQIFSKTTPRSRQC
mmetsp:Transcript_44512/g.70777  ORF Transcript_44512/g.70777 Transcript_44512/m.70777 type:complete len:237 (-) Transcript_44512:452-1162(-)